MTAENITWFEVDDYNTISYADFAAPETRSEIYCIYPEHPDTPEALLEAATDCAPLQWLIAEHYLKYREDPAHPDRMTILPEEPDEGWQDWLSALGSETFAQLKEAVHTWLNEPPNWAWEDDYIPDSATAQGSALEFFKNELALQEQLKIRIVEGEYPGSSYYAAELLTSVDEANAVAEAIGRLVRFRKAV